MSGEPKIIKGFDLTDPDVDSCNFEVWQNNKRLMKVGRYAGVWQVTIGEDQRLNWGKFMNIVEQCKQFIIAEEEAIARENTDE